MASFCYRSLLFWVLVMVSTTSLANDFYYQQLGIAITPRAFPNHTAEDIENAFRLAKKLGQSTVSIYQWGKLDLNGAKYMHDKTRAYGMASVIGLSPTTLDQGRKELDIPDDVRTAANGWISFSNPVIRNAFKKTVADIAKLKPDYFCLATEINLLGIQRSDEYIHFASLYMEAYDEVKRISPKTRVFVSFQHEWIRRLDAMAIKDKQLDRIKDHTKLIDIFRPKLDVVGLTTYPAEYHDSPLQMPADYYSWIYHHIPRSDRILLMETGWPTQGSGNELEQVQYIARLKDLLNAVDVEILAWALLHDVNLGEFDANLNSVGLIYQDGRFKPGLKAFDDLAPER